MPNWATGTLKVRGNMDEILKFCNDILTSPAGDKPEVNHFTWRLCGEDDVEFDDDTLIATILNETNFCIWMKDSKRHFIDMDTEVPYYWDESRKKIDGTADRYEYRTAFSTYQLPKNPDGTTDSVVVFPIMAAWEIREEYFEELSKKYKLKFKVYVVEQGIGYFEEALFENGETMITASGPTTGESENRTYGQFVWECPFPYLGG